MKFHFKLVDHEHRSLIHNWLKEPHIAKWFYGQGLENTYKHLDEFLEGSSNGQYWLAFDGNHPFAFMITSSVRKPADELTKWCSEEGEAITLDMAIGDTSYMGKGLSHILIQEFLESQFPQAVEVLIDPEASNARAIHVYQKAGFKVLGEYIPSYNPRPHCMMRLTRFLISVYERRLNLQNAAFTRIEHEDALVATVYKVTQPNGTPSILKICDRPNDYLREVYFLNYFAGKLPVPRIIQVVEPDINLHGAILMEFLPGTLLKTFTPFLAYEVGALLAQIHQNRMAGYGDLIQNLSPDPRLHFTLKFEEGLDECKNHLPRTLLERCRRYYDEHIDLLNAVDGPCIVHRDFRPGNLIVDDGRIQGIIDWSSAHASFAEEDFCSMEHSEWSINASSKPAFLAGYASVRPVPDYSALLPLLRLSRAIATIGFTVKRGTWQNSSASLYAFNRAFLDGIK